jgi:hypothetical protein
MTPEERFRLLLARLLEKTQRNEVWWEPASDFSEFSAHFDDVSVVLKFFPSNSEPDMVQSLLLKDGKVAVRLVLEDQTPGYLEILQLLHEADRCARKWDVALDALEKAIESKGKIGTEPMPF